MTGWGELYMYCRHAPSRAFLEVMGMLTEMNVAEVTCSIRQSSGVAGLDTNCSICYLIARCIFRCLKLPALQASHHLLKLQEKARWFRSFQLHTDMYTPRRDMLICCWTSLLIYLMTSVCVHLQKAKGERNGIQQARLKKLKTKVMYVVGWKYVIGECTHIYIYIFCWTLQQQPLHTSQFWIGVLSSEV